MILGLDPGSRWVGWYRSDGLSGTMDIKALSDNGDMAASLEAFCDWLGLQFNRGVTHLAIERPFLGRGQHRDFVGALVWAGHMVAYSRDIPRTEVTSNEVRKWLIGRGRRKAGEKTKAFDAAIKACLADRGYTARSEHACDAAAVVAYMLRDAEPL